MSVYAATKLQMCIKLAREASRNSWQCTSLESRTLKALRKVSREAIQDARRWKRELPNV
jgi:hypothetical protein